MNRLIAASGKFGMFPPGHYYSPIPSIEAVRTDDARIFGEPARTLPGIDMREEQQVAMVQRLAAFYGDMPFQEHAGAGLRYCFANPFYSYADGIFYYGMLRHLAPRRVIEVGSGFSSALALDTNERFFDGRIRFTFIEPYADRLKSLMSPADHGRTELIERRLQDVPLETFAQLEPGDILFIDSTHVSKVYSDVNVLLFEVLPALADGVYVHFHDIFYPFEYPKAWVYAGRAWNEAYVLRAFLQYNAAFSVVLMSTFLAQFHAPLLQAKLPLCLKDPGGSIWLRKG